MSYTAVAKRVYLPVLDRLKRTAFQRYLATALSNGGLSSSELRSIQTEKLDRLVRHTQQRSSAYRQLWEGAFHDGGGRWDPERIQSLPLLTKAFVFDNWSGMLTLPRSDLVKGTTSGSTGVSMTFYMNVEHVAWVLASQWRGRGWWGVERGDREFVLWGRPFEGNLRTEFIAWAKYRMRNTQQFSAFDETGSGQVEKWIRSLKQFRPKIIYGYGSSIARLAEGLSSGMGGGLQHPPVIVEYTADHMSEVERQTAARVLGAPVLSAYGASECGGIAQQCREGRLHVSIDHVFLEVVDERGRAVAPNETGELVVTTLNNVGMPLIRYRIGDLGALTDEECPCGSPFPVMRLQAGKAVDLVTTSFKSGVSAHVLDYINLSLLRHGVRGIRQFYVEQIGLDDFTLQVVREEPFDAESVQVFVSKMQEAFGHGIHVDVHFVDEIPLQATGKRRYFKKVGPVSAEPSRGRM